MQKWDVPTVPHGRRWLFLYAGMKHAMDLVDAVECVDCVEDCFLSNTCTVEFLARQEARFKVKLYIAEESDKQWLEAV